MSTPSLLVLGPLEVMRDGVATAVAGVRRRLLLAALAIEPGRTVPADALIDRIWGEAPPASAQNGLQVHVSQVRRELPGLVEAAPGGYRLAIPASSIDSRQFEVALARATRDRATLGPEGALDQLDAALALWRGPAYAELADYEFATAEANRLEELRLAAIEGRYGLLLELGREAEAVAGLEGLARQNAEHEGFCRLLMRGLYRLGRQAEAIERYNTLRDHLQDEYGIDPSPPVVRLYEAILRQDPRLDGAAERTLPPAGAATLRVFDEGQPAGRHAVAGPITTIGRSADNDIVLDATSVSRRHAVLRNEGGSYWLEDFGSTNGTSVNGRRIADRQALAHGDTIRIGRYDLEFTIGPEDETTEHL